jgi:hypothetical protein
MRVFARGFAESGRVWSVWTWDPSQEGDLFRLFQLVYDARMGIGAGYCKRSQDEGGLVRWGQYDAQPGGRLSPTGGQCFLCPCAQP